MPKGKLFVLSLFFVWSANTSFNADGSRPFAASRPLFSRRSVPASKNLSGGSYSTDDIMPSRDRIFATGRRFPLAPFPEKKIGFPQFTTIHLNDIKKDNKDETKVFGADFPGELSYGDEFISTPSTKRKHASVKFGNNNDIYFFNKLPHEDQDLEDAEQQINSLANFRTFSPTMPQDFAQIENYHQKYNSAPAYPPIYSHSSLNKNLPTYFNRPDSPPSLNTDPYTDVSGIFDQKEMYQPFSPNLPPKMSEQKTKSPAYISRRPSITYRNPLLFFEPYKEESEFVQNADSLRLYRRHYSPVSMNEESPARILKSAKSKDKDVIEESKKRLKEAKKKLSVKKYLLPDSLQTLDKLIKAAKGLEHNPLLAASIYRQIDKDTERYEAYKDFNEKVAQGVITNKEQIELYNDNARRLLRQSLKIAEKLYKRVTERWA